MSHGKKRIRRFRFSKGDRKPWSHLVAFPLLLNPVPTTEPEPSPDPPAPVHEPNHLRATLEMSLGLGVATLWYILDDRNVLDWDNPAIEQRFTGEAWRYDNNGFEMNFVLHPLSGGGTHVLARGNHIGFWPSAAYTLGVSFFWEYVIEFKEKVSINDMLVTTGGGVPIGEFFHKLGVYLNSAQDPGLGHSTLQWSLGTSVAMHRALDGPAPPPKRRDSLGLDADIWHSFELAVAPAWVSSPSETAFSMQQGIARGQLATLQGYGSARHLSRWFHEGELSRLDLAFQHSSRGIGLSIDADVLLAGYHHQQLGQGSSSRMKGHSTTTALGLEYRYRNSSAAGFDDRQGILRLPGPVFESWVGNGTLWTSLFLRAHPMFAGVSSPAYPEWRLEHPDPRTKAIVDRRGYFYGWGWSGTVGGELGLGALLLRGAWRVDRIDSQQGLDRAQERVELDIELGETLIESQVEARLRVPSTALHVGASLQRTQRVSSAGVERADLRRNLMALFASLRF